MDLAPRCGTCVRFQALCTPVSTLGAALVQQKPKKKASDETISNDDF